MKKHLSLHTLILALLATFILGCSPKNEPETIAPVITKSKDLVHRHLIKQIRLADGVPVNLDLAIRWKVDDMSLFNEQFSTVDTFNMLIMEPRTYELVSNVASSFESIDSVFYSQRQLFISDIKSELLDHLGESGIRIKEIILKDIHFPHTYTMAMEKAGLHRQELERIKQEKLVQIEEAEAQRQKAEANGKVTIAQAEAESKVQKIKAETEKYHRQNELAKAETASQVDQLRAKAEAERRRLLAQAEIDNKRKLNNLELERTKELEQIAIDKKRQLYEAELDQQRALAGICTQNPVYATYLVNKALAANVEFAVLPTGTNTDIFNDMLSNRLPGKKKRKVLAE